MLTVAILINGGVIVAKNAVNKGLVTKGKYFGCTKYLTDSGETIYHRREDGAVALAKALLDTIRNDGK